MHELAIAESVVAAVIDRVPEAKVTVVRLEIGALSGVVADSVRFCFDLVTEGTNLEGATLEIVEPDASCQCRDCGHEFSPDGGDAGRGGTGWYGLISLCPCGSADVAVLSGADLRILSVEVA
jgi:hydrogenase nickel incorporation protein HypA/HybF